MWCDWCKSYWFVCWDLALTLFRRIVRGWCMWYQLVRLFLLEFFSHFHRSPVCCCVLTWALSFPAPSLHFHRPCSERGQHRDHSAAGGGTVWARGLLVSVCGLELRGDHQEPQSPCSHRLWVCSPLWSLAPNRYSVFIFSLIFVFLSKQNI